MSSQSTCEDMYTGLIEMSEIPFKVCNITRTRITTDETITTLTPVTYISVNLRDVFKNRVVDANSSQPRAIMGAVALTVGSVQSRIVPKLRHFHWLLKLNKQ